MSQIYTLLLKTILFLTVNLYFYLLSLKTLLVTLKICRGLKGHFSRPTVGLYPSCTNFAIDQILSVDVAGYL